MVDEPVASFFVEVESVLQQVNNVVWLLNVAVEVRVGVKCVACVEYWFVK